MKLNSKRDSLCEIFRLISEDFSLFQRHHYSNLEPHLRFKMYNLGWRLRSETSFVPPNYEELYSYEEIQSFFWEKETKREGSSLWFRDLCAAMELNPQSTMLRRRLTKDF